MLPVQGPGIRALSWDCQEGDGVGLEAAFVGHTLPGAAFAPKGEPPSHPLPLEKS